jgi:hypothetical protein
MLGLIVAVPGAAPFEDDLLLGTFIVEEFAAEAAGEARRRRRLLSVQLLRC